MIGDYVLSSRSLAVQMYNWASVFEIPPCSVEGEAVYASEARA
jgi:hypothetical protein